MQDEGIRLTRQQVKEAIRRELQDFGGALDWSGCEEYRSVERAEESKRLGIMRKKGKKGWWCFG